jgi:tryptophan-rich sensory protein
MNFIASSGQLRASFMRWALFTVPLVVLLGFLAGQLGDPKSLWFINLEKPDLYPPPQAFGIVWSILYVMIGLALALVCSAWGAKGRIAAIVLFAVHFIGNMAWTPVFFGMQNIEGGLMVLAFVFVTLLLVIAAFWRVRMSAGLLLLPYLVWVCFAAYLNYGIMQLNPDGGRTAPTEEPQRYEI